LTAKSIFISSITSIVVIATAVGFFISYQTTPQIAFARIFIDVGMLIAVLSVCLTVPKAQAARAQELGTAMRELLRGQYDRRIQVDTEFGDLTPTAQAFNELASKLKAQEDENNNSDILEGENSRDPGKHVNEAEHHSHHPEIGAVAAIIPERPQEPDEEEESDNNETDNNSDHHRENISDNPIAQIEPNKPNNQDAMIMDNEQKENNSDILERSQPSHITKIPHNAQDLRQLYEEYSEALEFTKRPAVEFTDFRTTIHDSVEALKESHQCQDVKFKVVVENDNVALRPHLVR